MCWWLGFQTDWKLRFVNSGCLKCWKLQYVLLAWFLEMLETTVCVVGLVAERLVTMCCWPSCLKDWKLCAVGLVASKNGNYVLLAWIAWKVENYVFILAWLPEKVRNYVLGLVASKDGNNVLLAWLPERWKLCVVSLVAWKVEHFVLLAWLPERL